MIMVMLLFFLIIIDIIFLNHIFICDNFFLKNLDIFLNRSYSIIFSGNLEIKSPKIWIDEK